MQAMAKLQAAAGSAAAGGDDVYPFSTLAVWRDKLRCDLRSADAGPGFRATLLMQQGKDVEQAVLGCLKDCLFDLNEGVTWGLLDPGFEQQQRQALVNAAANELNTDKQLCVQLAHEHGVLGQYAARLQKQRSRALDDYERVGELRFGLLVWRANLRRDVALARNPAAGGSSNPQHIDLLFRSAYCSALSLIRRCADKSTGYWAGQQARNAPDGNSKHCLHHAAVQKVRSGLLELADTFCVERQALDRLFEEVPGPEVVGAVEGAEGAEGEDSEQGSMLRSAGDKCEASTPGF